MGTGVRRVLASLQLQQYTDVLFAEGFDTVQRLCLLGEDDLDALQVQDCSALHWLPCRGVAPAPLQWRHATSLCVWCVRCCSRR
jgi:hypothetical protein